MVTDDCSQLDGNDAAAETQSDTDRKQNEQIGENGTGEATDSSRTTEQPATVAKATETRADRRQEATERQQTDGLVPVDDDSWTLLPQPMYPNLMFPIDL